MNESFFSALRIAIGLVFTAAVIPKLRHPSRFLEAVVDYAILRRSLALVVGAALIPLELFLAFSHLTDLFSRVAVPLGLATLVVFAAAMAINLRRAYHPSCGCFGTLASERLSVRSLNRTGLLALGEAAVLWHQISLPSLAEQLSVRNAVSVSIADLGLAFMILTAGSWLLFIPDVGRLISQRPS